MSGHSKWHNIKLKKGKVDAQRGALFTKLSKEIILAAKGGSPDPEANYRLKMAVEKAREFNMPQENIKRAIARSRGQSDEREIEEIRYEGYGPHGLGGRRRRGDRQSQPHGRRAALSVQPARGHARRERQRRVDVRSGRHHRDRSRSGNREDALMEEALVDGVEDIEYDEDLAVDLHAAGAAGRRARCACARAARRFRMRISACARRRSSSCER